MVTVGIHIFRKDLRVVDNLALNLLAARVGRVVGVFIFDKKQITKTSSNKSFFSIHAAQFIIDSVNDLNQQCDNKLITIDGDAISAISTLIKNIKPSVISMNADYTPYAIDRDNRIIKLCKDSDIDIIINEDDQSLAPMQSLLKKDGQPYMVYGGFFKQLQKQTIIKPKTKKVSWLKPTGYSTSNMMISQLIIPRWIGGRKEGLRRLNMNKANGATIHVNDETSQLSAYMNQGCISIREVYWAFVKMYKSIEPIRSIAWRDFFLCIYRFAPNGNSYDKFIDQRYNKVEWPKVRESEWNKFVKCETGFLLVDAAMNQLLQIGFVQNRARLILATFWIKYLMINPLDETYGSQVWFSKLLIDCNASQNKLNHQWVLGDLDLSGRRFNMANTHPLTGRMMRIDNGVIKKYDPKFEYIIKWAPSCDGKDIAECKQLVKKDNTIFDWKDRYERYAALYKHIGK